MGLLGYKFFVNKKNNLLVTCASHVTALRGYTCSVWLFVVTVPYSTKYPFSKKWALKAQSAFSCERKALKTSIETSQKHSKKNVCSKP